MNYNVYSIKTKVYSIINDLYKGVKLYLIGINTFSFEQMFDKDHVGLCRNLHTIQLIMTKSAYNKE